MTQTEADRQRAAALADLRHRSLSRAEYTAAVRRIEQAHAGAIDQLARAAASATLQLDANRSAAGPIDPGSVSKTGDLGSSRPSQKPETAATASNQSLIVPKRKPGRPRIDALPDAAAGLTPKQRAFAEHYVALGGKSGVGSAAARAAGYAAPSADVQSAKLFKHPGVLDYIKHLSRQQLQAGAALGATQLVHLAENGRPKDAVKLKAATALLAHGGLAPVVQPRTARS